MNNNIIQLSDSHILYKTLKDYMSNFDFERNYWGDCCNTFGEDHKHYTYAALMDIPTVFWQFDVKNKSILDIGGGPTSMLLKAYNLSRGKVVDPIAYPKWTVDRYNSKNIEVEVKLGEDIDEVGWDEVWIYNCLQHTINPSKIIDNAKRAGSVLRICEWVDIPPHEGHPQELTENSLNHWIGQSGHVSEVHQSDCNGKLYYGVFAV